MVAVGFKAKWSAAFLVFVLSVFNVIANNFWSVHSAHPQRDFLKYDFFQTLCEYLYWRFCLFRIVLSTLWLTIFYYSDRWWSTSTCKHGPWRSFCRREEEGVLVERQYYERGTEEHEKLPWGAWWEREWIIVFVSFCVAYTILWIAKYGYSFHLKILRIRYWPIMWTITNNLRNLLCFSWIGKHKKTIQRWRPPCAFLCG